jgi:hypothetical protein
VLFTLTGLVFAFSSYPIWLRCLLSPVVLIAQVCDIACWWLARNDSYGPYFAQAIVGTGSVVGLGLAAQIVLGSLNLYGPRGKFIVIVLLALGGAGFAVLFGTVLGPALAAERK